MERINLYRLLLCSAALFINSSCTEETLPTSPPTSILPPTYTVPPTPEPPASVPTVFAGEDFQVILPTDFCWLSGGYSYVGTPDIDKIVWEKISGPSSYILENPNSLGTKLSKLEKGIYEFELTITNKKGLIGKDTNRITVGEISENKEEIIFKDVTWLCPMGCYTEIENIYSHLPVGSVFRIYMQRDTSANWEEVFYEYSASSQYTYILYNGNLFIFHYGYPEPEDTPNIKLVY